MAVRNDVSTLLARLGRQDLQYREFTDPLGDMEMWPMFEALLQDARIVGRAPTLLDQRRRSNPVAQRRSADGERAEPFEAAPVPAPPPVPEPAAMDPQVRAFIGQLGAFGPRDGGGA